MALKKSLKRLSEFVPDWLKGFIKFYVGLFHNKTIALLMAIFLVTGMIQISENFGWWETRQLDQRTLNSLRQASKANMLYMKAKQRERKQDSVEFEAYYSDNIDSLWRQRFEQRERELLDSIKRLQNVNRRN